MQLSDKQITEFDAETKHVIEWLNNNCHPLCKVIITTTTAELLEGERSFETMEFVKD